MQQKTLITYSLLTHLKETKLSDHSKIVDLFFPIVKKAIVEYAQTHGNQNVKGKNVSEIEKIIIDFFGIEIPPSVLDFILSQISKEISDDNVFAYYNDKSFIINTFVFNEIDEDINNETKNIEILKEDFKEFCNSQNTSFNFSNLIDFICAQKIELFSNNSIDTLNFEYHIPKYVELKLKDEYFHRIISDIYLGSLISSYFEYEINSPVANTELLIDTNFFISLIDLNTPEAFNTCNQLFKICDRLGFRFTMLYCTLDQIESLLNSRIQDFSNKEIGLIKEADVFGACIRRGLDKTQLERIKDNLNQFLNDFKIDLIYETRIKEIVKKARNSDKYKELLKIRDNKRLSALNDAIAYFYVKTKRGKNIHEFADIKCWFLNNTYHKDYHVAKGYKIHERYKISANELLTLLWLANPAQKNLDKNILAKGGLSSHIAKYKQKRIPSSKTLKEISQRAKSALKQGLLTDKDVFAVSVRMSEGQLTNEEASRVAELPDEQFIKTIKELNHNNEEILLQVNKQHELIKSQAKILETLQQQNNENQYRIAKEQYERRREEFVNSKISQKLINISKTAWSYIMFVILISVFWGVNYYELEILNVKISGLASFLIFIILLFTRFVEHKTVFKCLKVTFSQNYRNLFIDTYSVALREEYKTDNEEPQRNTFNLD